MRSAVLRALGSRARGQLHALRLATQRVLAEHGPDIGHRWARQDLAFMLDRHRIERRRQNDTPDLLANFAASSWSQNGEDGMLAELFRRLDVAHGFFVEIGAADGTENCTRALAEAEWTGVWVEADPAAAAAAAIGFPAVDVINALVTPDNVLALLNGRTPTDVDLLVLDIDSLDWRVLRTLLRHHRKPRVVVVEYNGAFPPGHSWTVSPRRTTWDHSYRHGASLDAIAALAAESGYSLAGCDPAGVNAFFVHEGPIRTAAVAVRDLYTAPWFTAQPLGHPRTGSGSDPMEPLTPGELEHIHVTGGRREAGTGPLPAREPIGFSVEVRNRSGARLSSGAPAPVNLAARWLRDGDTTMEPGARRLPLPLAFAPGHARRVFAWFPGPAEPGSYRLRVTAVQEGVAWVEPLHDHGWTEVAVDVVGGPGR
jgi:hypothetical protein